MAGDAAVTVDNATVMVDDGPVMADDGPVMVDDAAVVVEDAAFMALLVVEDMLGAMFSLWGMFLLLLWGTFFSSLSEISFSLLWGVFRRHCGRYCRITSVMSMCVWVYMMYMFCDLKQVT